MAESLGGLCIVLHGHLPYVLHHGSYPHGEHWLYEAAAETYLPLLDMIGEAALLKARPGITIGLTPVLLEQLVHPRFKEGFEAYLIERTARAKQDEKEFVKAGRSHEAYLARRWQESFTKSLEQFRRIGRDIPKEFAARWNEGHIQLLTSNATHAYMPLLLNDKMLSAQMTAGVAASTRILGRQPRGMWLPECAYRPHWPHWLPAVLFDNARDRPGVEKYIAAAGVSHFFVDTTMMERGTPMATYHKQTLRPLPPPPIPPEQGMAWGSVLEPAGVVSDYGPPEVFALARHPKVSEQVWSGKIGYPGAGEYMEFHRKYGENGLRYHKVTGNTTPLSDKSLYYPDDIAAKVHEHAQHFCGVVRQTLEDYKRATGRTGTVIAPFDAELFGHWWFEGPRFLRDVILNLAHDPQIKLQTAEEALYDRPADKVVRLPEGSWGEKGDHSVWINDKNKWMWEVEYRAEGYFLQQLHSLPWKTDAEVKAVMQRAGRQLLLLQASDWPFVVHTGGAVDYGIQRLSGHATNLNRALAIAQDVAAGKVLTVVQKSELADMDAHDNIFVDIDLEWWL